MAAQLVSGASTDSKLADPAFVLPRLSAATLGFDVDNLTNVLAAKALKGLREGQHERIEDAKTLAMFGLKLLPEVLALVGTPTHEERMVAEEEFYTAYHAARSAGQEEPTRPEIIDTKMLRAEHLREYLILLGPGIDIAKPLIEKAMILDIRHSPSGNLENAKQFASWARAYANASGGGKDLLPELSKIRTLIEEKRGRVSGVDPELLTKFINTLILEIETGKITPTTDYMFAGQW